jgi:hypothetical protein
LVFKCATSAEGEVVVQETSLDAVLCRR